MAAEARTAKLRGSAAQLRVRSITCVGQIVNDGRYPPDAHLPWAIGEFRPPPARATFRNSLKSSTLRSITVYLQRSGPTQGTPRGRRRSHPEHRRIRHRKTKGRKDHDHFRGDVSQGWNTRRDHRGRAEGQGGVPETRRCRLHRQPGPRGSRCRSVANWEAFGDAMQGATNDPMFHEFVAAMDAVSETVSRRILTSLDL